MQPSESPNLFVMTFACPANWDAMEGDEKSRFCNQCSMNVQNITSLEADEAERLIERACHGERVCVHSEGAVWSETETVADVLKSSRPFKFLYAAVLSASVLLGWCAVFFRLPAFASELPQGESKSNSVVGDRVSLDDEETKEQREQRLRTAERFDGYGFGNASKSTTMWHMMRVWQKDKFAGIHAKEISRKRDAIISRAENDHVLVVGEVIDFYNILRASKMDSLADECLSLLLYATDERARCYLPDYEDKRPNYKFELRKPEYKKQFDAVLAKFDVCIQKRQFEEASSVLGHAMMTLYSNPLTAPTFKASDFDSRVAILRKRATRKSYDFSVETQNQLRRRQTMLANLHELKKS